jgi:hypothetical protein
MVSNIGLMGTKPEEQCRRCKSRQYVDVEVRPGYVRRDCRECWAPPLRYNSGRLVDPERSKLVSNRIPTYICWVVWKGEPL